MIHIISPWSSEKNFGKAINEAIERLNPDNNDWVLLKDGDSCFLKPNWGNQIEMIVANADAYDLIGCSTNRLREPHQLAPNMFNQMDLKKHYEQAEEMFNFFQVKYNPLPPRCRRFLYAFPRVCVDN